MIYLLCYHTQSTQKRKSAQKEKKKRRKKHLATNMCIDHQYLNITDSETVQTKRARSDEQQFQQHLRPYSVFGADNAPTISLNILVAQ